MITGLTDHTDLTDDDHRTAETAARLLGVTAGACLGFTEKTLDRLATWYETLNPAAPYHSWTHGRFAASVRLEASLLKANTALRVRAAAPGHGPPGHLAPVLRRLNRPLPRPLGPARHPQGIPAADLLHSCAARGAPAPPFSQRSREVAPATTAACPVRQGEGVRMHTPHPRRQPALNGPFFSCLTPGGQA